MTKKIAIIGAGIAGTTTAYSLAKQDMDVTLIDSRRYPAMATSYANGGQLSASNSEVWNTPKNIKFWRIHTRQSIGYYLGWQEPYERR